VTSQREVNLEEIISEVWILLHKTNKQGGEKNKLSLSPKGMKLVPTDVNYISFLLLKEFAMLRKISFNIPFG